MIYLKRKKINLIYDLKDIVEERKHIDGIRKLTRERILEYLRHIETLKIADRDRKWPDDRKLSNYNDSFSGLLKEPIDVFIKNYAQKNYVKGNLSLLELGPGRGEFLKELRLLLGPKELSKISIQGLAFQENSKLEKLRLLGIIDRVYYGIAELMPTNMKHDIIIDNYGPTYHIPLFLFKAFFDKTLSTLKDGGVFMTIIRKEQTDLIIKSREEEINYIANNRRYTIKFRPSFDQDRSILVYANP